MMNKPCIFLLLLLPLLFSGCTSKEDAAEKYFLSGLSFYNNNEMEKARIEFLNAMQKNPQRADTYYYLGLIAKKEGDFPLVLENMNVAMLLDKTNLDAKANVAELYVFNTDFERANELADEILAIDPEYYDALRIKAAVRLGQKKYNEAKILLTHALKTRPRDATLHALNAVVEEALGNLREAVTHLDKAIASSEDKVQYLLFRSNIHRELNDFSALETDLRSLMKEKPKEETFIRSLAELLFEQGKEKKAMLLLRQFLRANPEKTSTSLFYVGALARKNKEKAMEELLTMIEARPTVSELRFYRIKWLMKEGQEEQAQNELKQIADDGRYDENQRLNARAILAEIFMAKGLREEAIALIDTNVSINPQHEKTLLLNAQNMLDGKHYEHAVSSLRTVLRNNPGSEKGLILLGHVYTQSGSELLADDSYRQALNLNPSNLGAAIPVVNSLLASQDLERSDKIITAALARRPKDQQLQIFLAQIKIMKKEWARVTVLSERLSEGGNLAYSLLLKGRVHQGLGDFDQAAEKYRKSLDLDYTLVPSLQGLAASYVALSKEPELLKYLESYQRLHPDTIVAYTVSAAIHKQLGEIEASINLLGQALKVKPSWVKGYAILAGQQNELGDKDGAIETYKSGIKNNDNDISLRVLLATYYESIKDLERSVALYNSIIEEQPENLLAINNYVILLLDKISTDDSIEQALRLAEPLKESSEPYFMDTVGWALVKNKRFTEGERYLRLASESADSIADIKYHLGVALKYLDRTEEAKKWLNRAAALSSNDIELSKLIERELDSL